MSYKKTIIAKGDHARAALMKGADTLAECVKSTLGPFGQNFFLEDKDVVTNDGVTVARAIKLDDEIENRGAKALREVAVSTVDEVGDGTTTSVTLAQAILKEASKYLGDPEKQRLAKRSPISIKKQIDEEVQHVTKALQEMAEPINTKEELIASALVSVEDEDLAEKIGGMQWELGKDGVIIVETATEPVTTIEKVNGFRIENSIGTSLIINNQEKQSLELEDVNVILTNYTINNIKPIEPLLNDLIKTGAKRVALVAKGFSSTAVQQCLANIEGGGLGIYPINAPFVNQVEILKDLASVIGATFIHEEERLLEDVLVTDVGFAKRIKASRKNSVFTGKDDEATRERIAKRAQQLKEKLTGEVSAFDRGALQQRVAQLENGFALLRVGSTSELERGYKKDKADDAVNAVRVALQEGVVPGAGLAFKQIAETLPDTYILKTPLQAINKHIMQSAPEGFVIESWVKDPVKVLRVALEKACSVAGTLATAGGVAVQEFDRPKYVQE